MQKHVCVSGGMGAGGSDFPNSPCFPGAQVKLKIGGVFGAISSTLWAPFTLSSKWDLGDF